MKHNLCENIKKYRKVKALTQEQLAEAVGVSVGTVSKWENGNCIPDISMIMELADFFEISVDVLVGYDTPLKKVPEILDRIEDYYKKHELDDAIMECSKALVKYPNNFDLLMIAGRIRFIMWYENKGDNNRKLAKELYKKAQINIPDDEKKTRYEFTILHNLALLEKNSKKRISLLKEININGMYDAEIGEVYRDDKDFEKAYEFFSEGLYLSSMNVINVTGRWIDPLLQEQKYDIAMKMIEFSEMIIKSIYKESEASIGTQMLANLEIIRAVIFETLSGHTEMRECVEKAVEIARKFDEAPVYDISTGASLWLSKVTEDAPVAFEETGPCAMKALEKILSDFEADFTGDMKKAAKSVRNYMMQKNLWPGPAMRI